MIPLLRVKNIKEAVAFYTRILDFKLKYPDSPLNEFGVELLNGDAELVLTSVDGISRVAVYVRVSEIDHLFKRYLNRGLITPDKEDSPVHESPIDQTWGRREFYVTDPDGNTLRFYQPIRES